MKKLMTVVLGLMFAVGMSGMAIAGSLDSPGAPSAGSGMYTLQNLYDYLTSGAALTVQSSFQEPTSGPGSTMKSTRQIGDAVATPFALCATTTAADVKSGKPFFCTVSGSWGVQTGTLVVPPTPTQTTTPTITPTPTPTKTWYEQYGPGGTGDVVQIGTMYVANRNTGAGSAADATFAQGAAISWGNGLVWLSKDDWRLPTAVELTTVCNGRSALEAWSQSWHWSSDTGVRVSLYATFGWCANESNIPDSDSEHVLAVRNAP